MPETPRPERATQNRVVALFADKLGYRHLGDWSRRENNRAIEEDMLREHLSRNYADAQISAALAQLQRAADTTNTTPYNANLRTYQLLRYGASVKIAADKKHDTVHFIDWDNAGNNDFALAEEVTLAREGFERRPDIVLYVNGIAVAVLELKRGSVELIDGVRQLVTNQEGVFNERFFSAVQLVMAGNDSQGLLYGTAGTAEQFFTKWKDDRQPPANPAAGELLDLPLAQMCEKSRLLDFIRNFVIFDGGVKKVPRPHQFFAAKAAQERIRKREGGVVWHTQGSGKSILMVLLAKWLLEYDSDARILIVTDRDELDKQIESVMKKARVIGEDEPSPRITTRAGFVDNLKTTTSRLMCALVHKFDPEDLKGEPPEVAGNFYVFVDECHRTHGGDMNKQMNRWLKGALFIGFTGTPLLKKDKPLTRDIFGAYIHTYKFHQGVADNVILDLKYEARDIRQRLTSQAAIDEWFDEKTGGLNNYQKAIVRKNWATMKDLTSAEGRKREILANIIADFSLKPRLNNHRGTAMLVAASIPDACHYFRLFQNTTFGAYCGIVTSYEPNHNEISREPPGSKKRYLFDTYTQHVLQPGQTTKRYEDEVKRRFIDEPANMKLLIVVDKLLTGFDAPSCTYIYLDSKLRDHNLFQAICRTNRLDGEDKDYGHIVDFKELFGEVQEAIAVYSSDELDIEDGGNIRLKDWLKESKKNLDNAREILRYMCEPVLEPREMEQYLRHFCGDPSDPEALNATEPLRIAFYKAVAVFVRAFADIAQDLAEAGYSPTAAAQMKQDVGFYGEVRSAVKRHSGEEFDIRPYEADMRHLLNTYVLAEPAVKIGGLDQTLTELIVESGINDAIAKKLNDKRKLSSAAVADGIINNIRKIILRHQLADPKFYEQMSKLLNDLINQSRADAEGYREFLRMAEALVKRLNRNQSDGGVPAELHGNREAAAVYNNLPQKYKGESRLNLALGIDRVMREDAPDDWKGNRVCENTILNALFPLLERDREATLAIFDIIKHQDGYK